MPSGTLFGRNSRLLLQPLLVGRHAGDRQRAQLHQLPILGPGGRGVIHPVALLGDLGKSHTNRSARLGTRVAISSIR